MSDEMDPGMALLINAADLRLSEGEAGDWLEQLARKLELAIPAHATVTRTGKLFSREKPVQAIALRFGDQAYELKRERHGLVARKQSIVRDVVLKTTEIAVERWTEMVADALNQLAQESAQARNALARLAR